MRHAREDYNAIQDDPRGSLIPEDEPVFLIRAKDKTGPEAVRAWHGLAKIAGAPEDILNVALDQACRMEAWQFEHGSKIPDMP